MLHTVHVFISNEGRFFLSFYFTASHQKHGASCCVNAMPAVSVPYPDRNNLMVTLRNPSERHCEHILRSRTVAVIAGLLLDQHITKSSCGACVLFLDFWLGFRFTSPKPWEPSTSKSKSRNVHIKYQFGAWCDFLLNY